MTAQRYLAEHTKNMLLALELAHKEAVTMRQFVAVRMSCIKMCPSEGHYFGQWISMCEMSNFKCCCLMSFIGVCCGLVSRQCPIDPKEKTR